MRGVVNFRISLFQLFLGVTAWCAFVGATVVELPIWVYPLAAIGASASVVFVFARCNSLLAAGFLWLPLICLANWSCFFVTLDFVFGNPSIGSALLAPVARIAAVPVVIAQNSVALARPWDTMFGTGIVSLIETSVLIFARYRQTPSRERGSSADSA
jgi:hypothetical protein